MIFGMESIWRKRKKKKLFYLVFEISSLYLIFWIFILILLYLIKDVQGVFVLFFKVHNRLTEKTSLCQCVVNSFTNPTVKQALNRWVEWGYWMNEIEAWTKELKILFQKEKIQFECLQKNSNLDQLCIDILFLYSLHVCMYRVWFDV